MILKLDPRWPVVWRTPQSAQVGVDPPKAILDNLTVTQERMLSALILGISKSGMTLLKEESPGERDLFLDALAPALATPGPLASIPVVALSGRGPLIPVLTQLLGHSSVQVLLAEDDSSLQDTTPGLAVVVGTWVLAPDIQSHWLRRDIPHLPITFSDTGVTVGPLIDPGVGPCLRCIDLHRTDADPAWPAIASQLTGMTGGADRPVLIAEAATAAFRVIMAWAGGSAPDYVSLHIDDQTGERAHTPWQPHPRCGCGGIDSVLS